MKALLLSALLASCASAPVSQAVVQTDPVSGEATAYATAFLDATSRLVLSAPVGKAAHVRLTLWTAASAETRDCTPVLTVGEHPVRAAEPVVATVDTPSGADQTVAFTLPPAALRDATTRPSTFSACGLTWTIDDEDRRAIGDVLTASE